MQLQKFTGFQVIKAVLETEAKKRIQLIKITRQKTHSEIRVRIGRIDLQ